jgi:hypothetical protein
MKTMTKIAALAVLVAGGFGACKKEYALPWGEQEESVRVMSDEMEIKGIWKITSFQWHLRDPNNHFNEYDFRFGAHNIVYAVYNNTVKEGKWHRSRDKLVLDFGGDQPLWELNNNWHISEYSRFHMVLKSRGPKDGSSEYVVMRKIVY